MLAAEPAPVLMPVQVTAELPDDGFADEEAPAVHASGRELIALYGRHNFGLGALVEL